jgi:tetratricopeptide (TPR) repeat protein
MEDKRKCYICGCEFGLTEPKCPNCGTQYDLDIEKALKDTAGSYFGFRSSGLEDLQPQKYLGDDEKALLLLNEGLELAHKEDFAGAEEKLRYAVAMDPKNPEIPFYLGSALFKTGRYLDAETQWRCAVSLAPGNPRYRKWLNRVVDILTSPF